jgi:muramoyltetrapeptide carboxypeptidase
VVAPAGRVDPADLQRGVARLERLGLKVTLGKHVIKSHRYMAGGDRERAEDFQAMFNDKEVHAVLCARGGSGSARIIPYLSPDLLIRSPKIFVGSSDITTLLLYLLRTFGWVTFHGPMVATQFGKERSAPLEENFFRTLSGGKLEMKFPGVKGIRPGKATGILTGGCLTLICATIGTSYEIETDDKIFFIEDIDEAPYRIDRMLFYLKTLGKFDRVRGVIFGQMPRCQPELLPEIILDVMGEFDFPILFGFPSGHGDATATLPFGISVRLDADTETVSLLEAAVL